MTKFKIFSTAVVLPLMFATPVLAQAAIQEPGAFAFYYPNYDVLNGGQPTPAARMDAIAGYGPFSGSYAYAGKDGTANDASCARRYRSHKPVSGTFLGYDGRRRKCE
jgi:opacity protein-like surface antigen